MSKPQINMAFEDSGRHPNTTANFPRQKPTSGCHPWRKDRRVVYLQPAGNSDRPPIRYNTPFTTCVRGLCHGIQPRFLPAHADRFGVGVSHALLVVAIGTRSRSTDTTHASDATTQTLHSTQTLYGSRPQ